MRMNDRFDEQATLYDERTAIGEAAAEVAACALALAAVQPDELVLELGAGTGQIGRWLAQRHPRYLGMDASAGMLHIFRRAPGAGLPAVVLADANSPWPLRDGAVAAAFASRVVHLLDAKQVVAQVRRVLRPGGRLLIGRVRRDEDGVRGRLRRERQRLLAERGIDARDGGEGTRRFVEACVAAGAQNEGWRSAARWRIAVSAAEVIAGWEPMSVMGNVRVEPAVQAAVLAELRAWAEREYGELDHRHESWEQYDLESVRFP
jgi:SAM-dependent methyltransferase